MDNELGTRKIGSLLVSYGLPAIASSLITAVYNLVDQIFIGQKIGYIGNAATQAVYPVTALTGSLALLFGIGGAVLFNIMQGQNKREEAMKTAGAGLFCLAVAGIAAGIIIEISSPVLVSLLGSTEEAAPMALTYLRIIALGIPFVIFTTGATLLIRSDGSPRFALLCTITGTGLNIFLDWLFIFPLDMGIQGAGIATVIGQLTVFVMVMWYLCHFRAASFKREHFKITFQLFRKITGIGSAGALNQASMLISQVVINNALRYYGELSAYGGTEALAAAGVVTRINMIFYFVMLGMSIGGEPIIGFNFGAGNYDRVRETYRKTLIFTLIVGAVETLCFWTCPDILLSIFGSGSETYHEFALCYMHVFMLFVAISGVPAVSMNVLSSMGKAKKGIAISLSKQIILILSALLLPLAAGIDGVLYAGITADVLAALASYVILKPELSKLGKE